MKLLEEPGIKSRLKNAKIYEYNRLKTKRNPIKYLIVCAAFKIYSDILQLICHLTADNT